MLSSLVPIFKRKGDPLNPNSYRGIKLFEHAFKLFEKVLDRGFCEVLKSNMGLCQVEILLFLRLF